MEVTVDRADAQIVGVCDPLAQFSNARTKDAGFSTKLQSHQSFPSQSRSRSEGTPGRCSVTGHA